MGASITALVPPLSSAVRAGAALLVPALARAPAGEGASAGARQGGSAEAGHAGHRHGAGGEEAHAEGVITMDEARIEAAGIRVASVEGGVLRRGVVVPGTIVASADRLVRAPARIAGTVVEVPRQLGDTINAGDVLAVLESREMAEAKAEYLAAARAEQLSRTTFERERRLWERRISAEQEFLRARSEAESARIRLDLAAQKLGALGLRPEEIAALPNQPVADLPRREVRSPIAGRVIERRVDRGASVSAETEMFVVADLSVVWVEMMVPAADLSFVREGQKVTLATGGSDGAEGRVMFVSPVLDNETRAARVVAELTNPDGQRRPGSFVTATIATEEQRVEILVPREAIQQIDGETVVFVRTSEGFEKREVVLGRQDERAAEVVFGLDAGDQIAVANTFVLKAELGKSEASHSH